MWWGACRQWCAQEGAEPWWRMVLAQCEPHATTQCLHTEHQRAVGVGTGVQVSLDTWFCVQDMSRVHNYCTCTSTVCEYLFKGPGMLLSGNMDPF